MTIIVSQPSLSSSTRTWLFLTQQLRQEAGGSGSGPTTCQGLTGESLRFATWINDAWLDIQQRHEDWDFLRKSFSFTTNAQQANYQATTDIGIYDLGVWKKSSFRNYVSSSGYSSEQLMPWIDYESYRNMYQFGNQRLTYNRPTTFSIGPLRDIWLGNIPDTAGYTVLGDYYSAPYQFVSDSDNLPAQFPDQFWKMIVHRAKMMYALYEENGALYQEAKAVFNSLLIKLEQSQLPPIGYGESLA